MPVISIRERGITGSGPVAAIEDQEYPKRYGRPRLPYYEGVKAFLFLESGALEVADPVEATELANLLLLELRNHKPRRAYFNQTIDLADWLLPVVYQNQPQRLTARPFTEREQQAYYERQATRYRELHRTYGFP